ncbi:unnamed protein product, partial [Brachionus calyciflorus]
SDASSTSSSFPDLTSTPIIQNLEKRFISHRNSAIVSRAPTSDDEFFEDLNFLNMISDIEQKRYLESSDQPSTLSITCFQKKRKNDHLDNSLESILSKKRSIPNEQSQE